MRRVGFCILAMFGLVAIGCDSGPPLGTVSGTITYKNEPLAGVDVNIEQGANAAQQRTDNEGKFKVDGSMPTGDYKVYITPAPPEPGNPGAVKKAAALSLKLPKKYTALATTDIIVNIKNGTNDFPIELKD